MKSYKKLYKSKENKAIFGVMGGLGEYFEIDPVVFRVMYLAFTIFSAFFPGILAYVLMAILIPSKSDIIHEKVAVKEESQKDQEEEKKD